MSISLIANSGIQFHRFKISINPNDDVIKTMGFYEYWDMNNTYNKAPDLIYAYRLPDHDVWMPKKILKDEKVNGLDENNNLIDGINYELIRHCELPLDGAPDEALYSVGDVHDALTNFCSKKDQNTWLPIPYFKKNSNGKTLFGTTAWARMMIKELPTTMLPQSRIKLKEYEIILAFDTKTDDDEDFDFMPKSSDTVAEDNFFALSNNEDHTMIFCKQDWVRNYLATIVYEKTRDEHPLFKQDLANYLYLLKYLEASKKFPEISLQSDKQTPIDVDLVLDIGNSNTCGLLFESPNKKDGFKFTAVKKLRITDLSMPEKTYNDSFSMRLAFADAKFEAPFADIRIIELGSERQPFRWSSLVRVGKEAARLINLHNLNIDKGEETANHHSSPKRYLWDSNKADVRWEFVNSDKKNVYLESISDQFKPNGELAVSGGTQGTDHFYSRKSLMTLVYIEILSHAIAQINSYDFRYSHGNSDRPRRLKRITITCPTSIVQKEQVILRQCAEEAVTVLSRFFANTWLKPFDKSNTELEYEIIPSPKDLAKNLTMIKERRDWIYDEATCCQLVFLYGEISERYMNKAATFFNLYGKKRDDVDNTSQKALTIGSLDIGGGTTDLMICAYEYKDGQSAAVIKPKPLYWESFNLAGDDLLKQIIQQIALEGTCDEKNSEDKGCIGVIENTLREKGVKDIADKMRVFFGEDTSSQDHIDRIFRKNFVVQILIPIAMRYLEHAIGNKSLGKPDIEIVGYNDFFPENKPNIDLLTKFEKHFGVKFEEIKWKLSRDRVFSIVKTTFDPIIKQISTILSAYGCDFVLLAGKPTTIPKIREMFIQYYPVSPERIITLNDYRVGSWYPYATATGYFEEPKTIVSVGALIALMAGKLDKFEKFKLDTDSLKRNLIATSDYIGEFNRDTQTIDVIYFTPDENIFEMEVSGLPMVLGYKQLPNKSYNSRPIFKLEFNEEELKRRAVEQDSLLKDNEKQVARVVEKDKKNYSERFPFTITIKRMWSESRENIVIEKIKDRHRNDISSKVLSLSLMTLAEEHSYWLDTGIFTLNIKK